MIFQMQMVYSAYQAMISHYRLKAFDKFKRDLDLPSSAKEGFAIKASRCAEACLSEFDHGCEGIKSSSIISGSVRKEPRDLSKDTI